MTLETIVENAPSASMGSLNIYGDEHNTDLGFVYCIGETDSQLAILKRNRKIWITAKRKK